MKKENIEKLIATITEKREEIIEMSKSCYKNTMDGSCFQGWNVGVIAWLDGDITDFYRSQNTTSECLFKGEAITVINYTVSNELGEIFYNAEDLTDEEQEKFWNWLLDNEYISIEEADEWKKEVNYSRLDEFDPEIIKRIDQENLEFQVDNYYAEAADEQIDRTLADLEQELKYIED